MSRVGGEEGVEAPQALLLDLDGTLVDNSGVAAAVRETCTALADRIGHDADELVKANMKVFRSYFPPRERDWALGLLSGAEAELESWRQTLHVVGCDDVHAVRAAAEIFADANRRETRLYEDAQVLLESIPASVAIGVVTNGAIDSQWQKLRATGIADRFDAIVISAEFGVMKPDPAIFVEALRRLGTEPEAAWHVGDSVATDVAGANQAGITSVWLDRPGRGRRAGEPMANHTVSTLDAVPAIWDA